MLNCIRLKDLEQIARETRCTTKSKIIDSSNKKKRGLQAKRQERKLAKVGD